MATTAAADINNEFDIFERAANPGQFGENDILLAAIRKMNINDIDADLPTSTQIAIYEPTIDDLAGPLRSLSARYAPHRPQDPDGLAPLPIEIIGEIGSHLGKKDLMSFRLVSTIFNCAAQIHFSKAMVCNRTLFPTYKSIGTFISLLKHNSYLAGYIRSVTLVGEALRMHEVGYAFAWDRVGDQEDVWFTDKDIAIMRCVKEEMMREVAINGSFCNGGVYRTMLAMMVAYLPKLETLYLRKLYLGEHVPGWKGPKALEGLSFYRPDLNINDIFYGNWKYDTTHLRVTSWIDEFGEEMEEDGAGPQAQFDDDVIAVIESSGREIWTEHS